MSIQCRMSDRLMRNFAKSEPESRHHSDAIFSTFRLQLYSSHIFHLTVTIRLVIAVAINAITRDRCPLMLADRTMQIWQPKPEPEVVLDAILESESLKWHEKRRWKVRIAILHRKAESWVIFAVCFGTRNRTQKIGNSFNSATNDQNI